MFRPTFTGENAMPCSTGGGKRTALGMDELQGSLSKKAYSSLKTLRRFQWMPPYLLATSADSFCQLFRTHIQEASSLLQKKRQLRYRHV